MDASLSLEDKKTLMKIARQTVEACVQNRNVPDFPVESSVLKEKRGAFVTLRVHGQLRGCIGYTIPIKPLYQTVAEVAEAAAQRDPRFPPVRSAELPNIEYEISALTPLRPISDVSEIQVGVHGIMITKGFHQGLLLPQVATEAGWDREQFLRHTCRKAGLPDNAWQDPDTEIKIFAAEIFEEHELT